MNSILVKTILALYLLGHVSVGFELAVSQSKLKWVLFIMFVVFDAWLILSGEYGKEE